MQNATSAASEQLSSSLLQQNHLTNAQIEVDSVQGAIYKEAERQRL